jgi:hypothetical protein
MSSAFNIPADIDAIVSSVPRNGRSSYDITYLRDLVAAGMRSAPAVDAVPGEPVAQLLDWVDSICSLVFHRKLGGVFGGIDFHRVKAAAERARAALAASVASRAGTEPVGGPAPGYEEKRPTIQRSKCALFGGSCNCDPDTVYCPVHNGRAIIAPAAAAEPREPPQELAEPVTVAVERMVESVNGVSWWVVLRRGPHRQDDGKYGADFKNRAEWHAAGLRWILGQGDKPNIRDFMDAEGSAGEAQS